MDEKLIDFLLKSIKFFQEDKKEVFLLNHEGQEDLDLCFAINRELEEPLEIVTGLSAKQVKGVLAQAYIVISSRFHGVASSLSSGVPCLSTSWNHKYKMLYADFEMKDQVIHLDEGWEINKLRLQDMLENGNVYRNSLVEIKEKLILKNEEMWNTVWVKVQTN